MYGRTAITRSPAHVADPAAVNLRRRMALAVARRFGSAGQKIVPSKASRSSETTAVATVAAASTDDADPEIVALDQRVRETGEW